MSNTIHERVTLAYNKARAGTGFTRFRIIMGVSAYHEYVDLLSGMEWVRGAGVVEFYGEPVWLDPGMDPMDVCVRSLPDRSYE